MESDIDGVGGGLQCSCSSIFAVFRVALIASAFAGSTASSLLAQEAPFVLSDAQMSRITAGGIVSDAASYAAAYGSEPLTSSDAVAGVDPSSGDADARGVSRGPAGSDGHASTSVTDGDGRLVTTADADGRSADDTATDVSAGGRATLGRDDYSGGSMADAASGESNTNSSTGLDLTSEEGSLSSTAIADGVSNRRGASHAATDVAARLSAGRISHRSRSSGSGDDVSSVTAKGSVLVERIGHTLQTLVKSESSSSRSNDSKVSQVIISNQNGVFVRLNSRAATRGGSLVEPSATTGLSIDGDGHGTVLMTDRAARRAGEARASTIMLMTPKP